MARWVVDRGKEKIMSAVEPAGETMVRNLQKAVSRLHDDIAKVEMWADALTTFVAKPVPDYDPAQSRYALRRATQGSDRPASTGMQGGKVVDLMVASKS
jgi:uncharacterized protein (DUF2342 family)